MIPYRNDFAHINIPVLTTTGYFDSHQPDALYYFAEHYRFNPKADQTLLIGPYDDVATRRGALPLLDGYQVDSAALIDLRELRYQWFDYILRGGVKPAVLQDRVNYQVMGGNTWEHAPSLDADGEWLAALFLDPAPAGCAAAGAENALESAVRTPERQPGRSQRRCLDATLRSGQRQPAASRRDSCSSAIRCRSRCRSAACSPGCSTSLPTRWTWTSRSRCTSSCRAVITCGCSIRRTAFVPATLKDRSHRHLLQAGVRQQLNFRSDRLMSRKCSGGQPPGGGTGHQQARRPADQLRHRRGCER
jgi:hypothetical protein